MHGVSAIVCFGIAEPRVDDLIEATRGTAFESARWLVFGRDMRRLGGLVAQWQDQADVIVVHVPRADAHAREAAFLLLENEDISVSSCIWLQGEDAQCPLPSVARAARLDAGAPQDSLSLLHRLAAIDVAARD